MSEVPFQLDSYLSAVRKGKGVLEESGYYSARDRERKFSQLCKDILDAFNKDWEDESGSMEVVLERQKRAIIGYEKEVKYFKDKIDEHLKRYGEANAWFPPWYKEVSDAVFHENWGLAGIAQWVDARDESLRKSSSAKVIGERIYFMKNGKLELQPQKISLERRKQLRKALLLKTPQNKINADYHEVYMLDGTRITIFAEGKTKENLDSIVFRKFFVSDYSFEKQVELGTISGEMVPLFRNMIDCGFNVAFTGAVRTAKTTFLTTWQSYENPELEGVSIETDPEIPLHLIMPNAPILQIVADGEALEAIVKSIMRSDADYIVLGEARDGIALNIAVKIANKGTRRVKMTYHTSDPIDFCYDVADEITKTYGGSLYSTILKVAKSFQFIFHFIQLEDKSKKRLNGIYNIDYCPMTHEIKIHRLCRYIMDTDSWVFSDVLSESTKNFGKTENHQAITCLEKALFELSKKYPENLDFSFRPALGHLKGADTSD